MARASKYRAKIIERHGVNWITGNSEFDGCGEIGVHELVSGNRRVHVDLDWAAKNGNVFNLKLSGSELEVFSALSTFRQMREIGAFNAVKQMHPSRRSKVIELREVIQLYIDGELLLGKEGRIQNVADWNSRIDEYGTEWDSDDSYKLSCGSIRRTIRDMIISGDVIPSRETVRTHLDMDSGTFSKDLKICGLQWIADPKVNEMFKRCFF